MVSCREAAIVVGSESPAMSVMYADGYFSVFFAEFDPDGADDEIPSEVVCAGCLIEDGDAQLGRGLDLARVHGQVDFDPESGEWFIPAREGRREAPSGVGGSGYLRGMRR